MSSKNYLDLDINKLFKEHKIKDIEEIQKKIQAESDWKKVELRTLVGERYRDLIQAADTIAEMRKTTESVIQRIADIEDTFKDLNQKYLIGFKIDPPDESLSHEEKNVMDAVIVQIKILMDIPEHIWSAIDDKNLMRASQLFILAQHINYSLIFEVGQANLAQKYPVVTKQWSMISNFRRIIAEECHHILGSTDLTPEVAANCLASLVLMEKTNSKDLLDKLINLRSRAIESIVKSESPQSVRHRIKLSVKMLIDTVALIHFCFINAYNQQSGLITTFIKEIMDQESLKMLCQLDLSNQIIDKYLPSVTKNHKLFAKDEFTDLSSVDLHSRFNLWLSWVKTFTATEISRLLNLVTSVKGIYNIREESIAIQLPEYWTNIWKDLSLPIINFWTEFYHPLLTDRVKEIVQDRWKETLTDLKTKTTDFLSKLTNEKFDYPENDLRWFIWKDSPTDIPQKLSKSGSSDVKRSLLMKARGYSPNLVNLCESFDENLHSLLLDLEQYLYETEKMSSVADDLLALNLSSLFDKFNDRSAVQENLQQISTLMIDDLIIFIEKECICETPKYGKSEINVIVMARFLQALTALCPNLNKCFTLSKISGLTISNVKWQSICDKMKDKSTSIWSIWASRYRNKVKDHANNVLRSESIDGLKVATIISEWEKVTIEEEAEDGKRIKSEILVPYQPSACLTKFLATIMKDLNKVVPHTIPRKVLHELIENIVIELFNYYEEVSKCLNLKQKQAFQVLLDVKYITMLMVSRENKTLTDRSVELCNNVQEKIDPFDSDVFFPFIHVNVKKSVQRSLLIFGNVVPQLEQLYSVLGARSELNDSGKSIADPPGVLAICTGAPWFSPLAVTVPSKNLPLISVTMPDKAQIGA
ncbi:conserved oligomeric Golgi complex subunit 1 isoform X2 [Chelonus insularis]|uniref:conserved oligomeric Golgi complex subunit 1 isoform X2 n=1 Tax=Chelonus insularis TaxID=460826 RepID=UPI00158D3C44|nr:conserved oligomeric Golgi complex subunit 1 isoform X2 [Chelonus insularis]